MALLSNIGTPCLQQPKNIINQLDVFFSLASHPLSFSSLISDLSSHPAGVG